MKIYDCFSYWDEDLLLDLRLNILNEYVDYFVIVEGNKTWQNNNKNFRFNINNFSKFKDKIIYIKVDDLPDGITNELLMEISDDITYEDTDQLIHQKNVELYNEVFE